MIELFDKITDEEIIKEGETIEAEIAKEATTSSSDTADQLGDCITMYFMDMKEYKVLSKEDEIEYFKLYQDGEKACEEMLKAGYVIDNAPDDIRTRIKKGDHARDILINSNLRLVISIAKRYKGRGLDFEDMIQEGNIGLMKAIERFDPSLGYKFSTYATWWIEQGITRALSNDSRSIRLPVHVIEKIAKIKHADRKLTIELGRDVTYEDLAKETGFSEDYIRSLYGTAYTPLSLDSPVSEEDMDSTLGDFISDSDEHGPQRQAEREDLKERMRLAMERCLDEREMYILRRRYGMDDGMPRTLEMVGKELGVTRERIRQIEAKAIKKLKHPQRAKLFKTYRQYVC